MATIAAVTPANVVTAVYTGLGMSALTAFVLWPGMPTLIPLTAALLVAAALVLAQNVFRAGMAWLVLSPALYPFARYPQSGTLLTFDRVCLGALALALMMKPVRRVAAPSVRAFAAASVAFAALFLARALTTHPQKLSALQTFVDAVVLPCIAFAVCRRTADTDRRLRTWAAGLMVCGTIVALIGITERLFGYELASRSGGEMRVDYEIGGIVRVSGPYSVPEVFALILALTLAATLFWWTSGRVRGAGQRHLPVVAGPVLAAVQVLGLAVSLFRVAWACALLVVVVVFGLRAGQRMRLATVGIVVTLGALLLFLPLQRSDVVRERLGNTANVAGRFATYEMAGDIWRSAPLTGVGIHQFAAAQSRVPTAQVWGVRAVVSPHSSFLGTLAEQGILGFGALLAVCGYGARMLRRLAQVAPGNQVFEALRAAVLAAALSYLAFSIELTMLPWGPSNVVLGVVLGLGAATVDRRHALGGADEHTAICANPGAGSLPVESVR